MKRYLFAPVTTTIVRLEFILGDFRAHSRARPCVVHAQKIYVSQPYPDIFFAAVERSLRPPLRSQPPLASLPT